jgi:hypothetical protein
MAEYLHQQARKTVILYVDVFMQGGNRQAQGIYVQT